MEDGAAVAWSSEVGAADWIVERLHPFASDVGSFVPEGLEAYARVLHPARRLRQGRQTKVRWADVAREAGTAVHPAVQFEKLRLGPEIEPPLEGYGWMQGGRAVGELVHRGPIEAAAAFCQPPASQSPNLWWPADRAWCVASDIDLPSTYLGGTRALVEEVLEAGRLEAVPARLTDPTHP